MVMGFGFITNLILPIQNAGMYLLYEKTDIPFLGLINLLKSILCTLGLFIMSL